MWYKNAFAIGSAVEGTIRCTYATIYDKQHEKLFTLRTDVFSHRSAIGKELEKYGYYIGGDGEAFQVYTGEGNEAIDMWLDRKNPDFAEMQAFLNVKFPLVWADQYMDETHEFVPVKLLFPAVEYIVKTLKTAPRKIKYTIYRKKDDKVVQVRYSKPTEEDEEDYAKEGLYWMQENCITEQWQRLIDSLNTDDTFYVKPAAFNWMPTNTDARINRDPIGYEKDLEDAEKELNEAKRAYEIANGLLAAAGISNILIKK